VTRIEEMAEKYNIQKVADRAEKLGNACPVARVNPDFSPYEIAVLALSGTDRLLESRLIWECLACGMCKIASDGEVDMSCFIRDIREEARGRGFSGTQTHGGMLILAQELAAGYAGIENSVTGKKRNKWLTDDLKVESEKGEYLFWAGGAPIFDAAVPELEPRTTDSVRASILLLNKLGIRPVLLENEQFSGHDLLWSGDTGGFMRLAERNLKAIEKSEARVVLVGSPEDYYTIARSYPERFGALDFQVHHITEFIARRLDGFAFRELKKRVTYHDPCRLGRGMGVYDAPREILRAIPGVEFVEMPTSREHAACCGTSCWINCTGFSKLMQVNRLREAASVGAELLVSACWECIIHFKCAIRQKSWKQVYIDIEDLVTLTSSLLRM
jgi:heterodisulfide reductase subunit D